MEINIDNRVVLIVGPSTTGKTTLSKRIQEESSRKSVIISHDEVLKTINQSQTKEAFDTDFRLTLLKRISDAIADTSNELIILDTLNFDLKALFAFLYLVRGYIGYNESMTLIKMFPPLELHVEYILERAKLDNRVNPNIILNQRQHYISNRGSLYTSYRNFGVDEIVISNLEDLYININTKNGPIF